MSAGHRGLTMKMDWALEPRGEATWLRLRGAITERADFGALLGELGPGPVVVDLAGVTRVNSIGVRHWVDFVGRLCEGRRVELEECSPAFVEQLMLIERMQGDAEVRSIRLPFLCDDCDHGHELTLPLTGQTEIPLTAPCPRCRVPSELDDLPERYTSLLTRLSSLG